jgi:hypothetical protein
MNEESETKKNLAPNKAAVLPPKQIYDKTTKDKGFSGPNSASSPLLQKSAIQSPGGPQKISDESSKKSPKRSVAQVGGKFARTKSVCPLMSEPVDGTPSTFTKHPRKIWVEEHDASWYRAYNKSGSTVFVRKDCLQ